MGKDDPLDAETSVSVELTERGVKANAKSRLVAAVDRLGGNLVDSMNAPLERRLRRSRAISEGETRLIKAAAQYGIERMKADDEFARRALEHHFKRAFDAQANKDAVIVEALEDLRREPPNAEDAASGDPVIGEQFMARFERYTEDATTEELQQRWGRVLAREVRRPGTFSPKALRIVDEIEAGTALLFEELCASRVSDVLPVCLVGELSFNQVKDLTGAGLLVDPGMTGQVRRWHEDTHDGQAIWGLYLERFALAFPKSTPVERLGKTAVVRVDREKAMTPVYVLTDVGRAISTMLPDKEKNAVLRLVDELKKVMPSSAVYTFQLNPFTNEFVPF